MATSTSLNASACGFTAPATCSRAGTAKWHVVWCHEWIHKEELNEKRLSITKAVEAAGAVLHCLKKATTFEKWLANHVGDDPYVLLTNWRLTKPCVDILLRIPQVQLPTLTVIHCESATCFPPAIAWAHQNHGSTVGRVHVSDSLNFEDNLFAKGFFGGLASQLFELPVSEAPMAVHAPERRTEPWRQHSGFPRDLSSSVSTCSPVTSSRSPTSSCSTPPSFHLDSHLDYTPIGHYDQFAAHRDKFAAAAHSAAASTQHIAMNDLGVNSQECFSTSSSYGLELAQGVAAQTKEWSSWDTLMQCTDVKAVVFNAACQALQPAFNYCSAKEVEDLLVQAMPDRYDD